MAIEFGGWGKREWQSNQENTSEADHGEKKEKEERNDEEKSKKENNGDKEEKTKSIDRKLSETGLCLLLDRFAPS